MATRKYVVFDASGTIISVGRCGLDHLEIQPIPDGATLLDISETAPTVEATHPPIWRMDVTQTPPVPVRLPDPT